MFIFYRVWGIHERREKSLKRRTYLLRSAEGWWWSTSTRSSLSTATRVVNVNNILTCIRAVRQEGQMPLGTLVCVMTLGAAFKARNLLDWFGWQTRWWSHTGHHESTRTMHAVVLTWSDARVHLLLHVLLSYVGLSHLKRNDNFIVVTIGN